MCPASYVLVWLVKFEFHARAWRFVDFPYETLSKSTDGKQGKWEAHTSQLHHQIMARMKTRISKFKNEQKYTSITRIRLPDMNMDYTFIITSAHVGNRTSVC